MQTSWYYSHSVILSPSFPPISEQEFKRRCIIMCVSGLRFSGSFYEPITINKKKKKKKKNPYSVLIVFFTLFSIFTTLWTGIQEEMYHHVCLRSQIFRKFLRAHNNKKNPYSVFILFFTLFSIFYHSFNLSLFICWVKAMDHCHEWLSWPV